MTETPYAFRIVGPTSGERRLCDAAAAFGGYATCTDAAHVESEAYLSAFTFDDDFAAYLRATGSTAGFAGVCGASWLWWDIDAADDLDTATSGARRLTAFVCERLGLADDDVLVFYSGSKGFHVGIPTVLWGPEPSATFHRTARRMAERIAEAAGVTIDAGVYDKVRTFRAPNSRHPKTGRHKRRLTVRELLHLDTAGILRMAADPMPFDVPEPSGKCDRLAALWAEAVQQAQAEAGAKKHRDNTDDGSAALNRLTLDFIRNGAETGDRHRLLFSAAANLADFTCPPALAHALLTDAGLDSGLSPSDVRRQIECGLNHKGGGA